MGKNKQSLQKKLNYALNAWTIRGADLPYYIDKRRFGSLLLDNMELADLEAEIKMAYSECLPIKSQNINSQKSRISENYDLGNW
jgi:hypothetical protein